MRVVVSILVFLDRPLRAIAFSPIPLILLSFQSLFSWIDLCVDLGKVADNLGHFLFQSLFSWIDLCVSPIFYLPFSLTFFVSILVFLDRPLRVMRTWPSQWGPAGFQSLFSWIDLCVLELQYQEISTCHVSILVFLDRPLRVSGERGYWEELACFNPCFLGSTSACTKWVILCPPGAIVSILVFLDRPLRDAPHPSPQSTSTRVSILVFLDRPLRGPPEEVGVVLAHVFQSLFSWIDLCVLDS